MGLKKLSEIDVDEISLVGKGANRRTFTILKSADDMSDEKKQETKELEEKLAKAEERATAAENKVADFEAKVADLEKRLPKDEKPEADTDELLKGLPEPVRKAVERVQWAQEQAESKAKTLEDRIRKSEEESKRKEFIQKAQDYKDLPGANPDDLGPILMKAKDALTESEWHKLNEMLRGSAEAVRQSKLFKELGSDLAPEGSAKAALQAKVSELRKAKPDMTEAEAVDRIMETDAKLADLVLKEEKQARS